jgi:hypothetical protein
MNDSAPPQNPPKKRRGWCAWCLLIPLLSVLCLVGAYFLGPWISDALNLFGPDAEEVYSQAPDLEASRDVEDVFASLNIPGVRAYVIPLKDEPTQGAFVILDASQGYQGLYPQDAKDDHFQQVVQAISRVNREKGLRLSHVSLEYRDEAGEKATAFTAPQELIDQYADGVISQDEFFSQIEVDILSTIEYLDLDQLLEEIQR